MNKVLLFVITNIFCISSINAQLLPSIGLNSLPSDNQTICIAPWYLGSFYTSGLQKGNQSPDFKLYNLNGDSLQLSQKLATGKPVLLVAGSLTCPVFMGKIPIINQVMSTYGNLIQVYVIYTLEAHPTDTSVYFGYINVGAANQNAGILFPQPTTYGQRKKMVDTLPTWGNLNAPIFIDGPCNEWWSTFGPAPNNSYVIDTNGEILSKHGWFHKNQDNIFCDLDTILNFNSGLCSNANGTGNFVLQVLNSSVNGTPGSILYDYANLINNTASDITIGIKKLQKNHSATWQTAFCADVCYSPTDDSITVIVPSNDTLLFSLDFITDMNPDSGSVKVGFRNINNFSNNFTTTFKASTYPLYSNVGMKDAYSIYYWPNPCNDVLYFAPNIYNKAIYTIQGQKLLETTNSALDINSLPKGLYILKADTYSSKVIKN